MKSYIEPYGEKMTEAIERFENELARIRAGRANPDMLNNISVDYYGVQTPISQIGNISVPEARVILIQPWEASIIKDVERAIHAANIGVNPMSDGKVIRVVLPELNEERRVEITKDVKQKGEEAKVAIRNIRRDGMEEFKKLEKNSEIAEDQYFQLEELMQEETDKQTKKIDQIVENKTNEVMNI